MERDRLQCIENLATAEALAITSYREDDVRYWNHFADDVRVKLPDMTSEESALREKIRTAKVQEFQRPIGRCP